MIQNDQYEYDFIKSILKPTDVCLDIGANEGYYTKLMAQLGAQVYAFEPDIENFEMLIGNVYPNCVLSNKAVTNYSGKTRLYKCYFDNGMHRIYPSKWCVVDNYKEIDCVSIDEFMLPELESLDFVKIDVEGSEWGALQGMKETIRKFRPSMVIEFHPPSLEELDETHPKKIYEFLKKHYKKINLLGTSFLEGATTNILDISCDDLMYVTRDNPARNIYVTGIKDIEWW